MRDMEGRLALVTGSGTGLGRSMAVQLAQRGADVIVNYSRSDADAAETGELCRAAGAQVQLVQADVARTEDCARLAAAATARGHLDILINNAGITRHAPDHGDLDALSAQDFMDVYAVNVVGAYLMVQACAPLLRACRPAAGRPAAVLMTASIAGVQGIGSSVAYAASKGALITMTRSLARGMAPEVRVNAICPGFIGTRWFREGMDEAAFAARVAAVEAATPLAAASGPDDIAEAALFFVSDAARHVTGETLLADAGMHLGRRA